MVFLLSAMAEAGLQAAQLGFVTAKETLDLQRRLFIKRNEYELKDLSRAL